MAHEVFISHSQHDATVASAVCARLEQSGIRCWVAPRDVPPGRSWPAAIVEAVDGCQIMVLILSDNSNKSQEVHKEVHLAIQGGKTVLPLRISNLTLDPELKYHLMKVHWLDALTPPLESHLSELRDKVSALLRPGQAPVVEFAMAASATASDHVVPPRVTSAAPPPLPRSEVASAVASPPTSPASLAPALLPLFPCSSTKLIVMCIATWGLYSFYWTFQHWRRIKANLPATQGSISPFWRMIFEIFWDFSLFRRIRAEALARGLTADFSPDLFAAINALVSVISGQLPGLWVAIPAMLNFLPLIPANNAAQAVNRIHFNTDGSTEDLNDRFSVSNIMMIAFGAVFWVFAIIGLAAGASR